MAAFRCTHGLNKHLRSHLLGRRTKIKIYKTLIKPILTYACEIWTLSKSDENLLLTFEKKIYSGKYSEMVCGGEDVMGNCTNSMTAMI